MQPNLLAQTQSAAGWFHKALLPESLGNGVKPAPLRTSTDIKCQEKERKRAKRKFQPFNESEKGRLLDKEKITEELQELFTEKASNSVFVLTQTKQKSPQPERPILPVDLGNATKGGLTADDLDPNTVILF